MPQWLFLLPVISAVIGLLIHTIAGSYLLKSYLPGQDNRLAQKLAEAASQYLSGTLNIDAKLSNPELIEKAMPSIEKHIDEFLNVKLKEEIPMLAMFVGNKTTDKIKEVFIDQLKQLFPQVMLQITGNLKDQLNIEATLLKQLKKTPVSSVIKEELKGINAQFQRLGLLFGFIIGLINLIIVYCTIN
ncbi:hypothetical protein A8C56_08570 [Niabella ginsenosidivorans]|uniref:DUF445 domain-containing protein n=1 Tax=Niabella ginsenosidivorans TaxID=1176587 RepID=A0A1A9I116_9BACT|nr:hypothetical protein [Niabella ginsenosidivorans]ANH81025.1 hypothetical protein A8C56_08570 [Niabella ginsenosidivorans]